jgi:hypothetical protein
MTFRIRWKATDDYEDQWVSYYELVWDARIVVESPGTWAVTYLSPAERPGPLPVFDEGPERNLLENISFEYGDLAAYSCDEGC